MHRINCTAYFSASMVGLLDIVLGLTGLSYNGYIQHSCYCHALTYLVLDGLRPHRVSAWYRSSS